MDSFSVLLPPLWLILATIMMVYVTAAANALNVFSRRDIDEDEAHSRPDPRGDLSPRAALDLRHHHFDGLRTLVGPAGDWASATRRRAMLLYVVFYTIGILKRRTSQNIVWGGVAGCHAGADRLVRSGPGRSAGPPCCCSWSSSSGPAALLAPGQKF